MYEPIIQVKRPSGKPRGALRRKVSCRHSLKYGSGEHTYSTYYTPDSVWHINYNHYHRYWVISDVLGEYPTRYASEEAALQAIEAYKRC